MRKPSTQEESLVSQLQEAYTARIANDWRKKENYLQAIQEMQDRTGVTSDWTTLSISTKVK